MANIYEIQDKYKMIQSLIEQGIEPESFEEALKAIDGELSEKLENYAAVIKNIESDIAGLKTEEGRLKERRKSMENNIERMKKVMEEAMLASDKKKVKGEKFNFNIQKNPPSVYVLDENLIPQHYVNVEEVKTIDKKAILHELKAGVEIEGVEIKQSESLRIK